jgi:hypothetical protein
MDTNNIHAGDTRYLLLALRQALIIALGALESYLDMPRSIEPKRKREKSSTN